MVVYKRLTQYERPPIKFWFESDSGSMVAITGIPKPSMHIAHKGQVVSFIIEQDLFEAMSEDKAREMIGRMLQ